MERIKACFPPSRKSQEDKITAAKLDLQELQGESTRSWGRKGNQLGSAHSKADMGSAQSKADIATPGKKGEEKLCSFNAFYTKRGQLASKLIYECAH